MSSDATEQRCCPQMAVPRLVGVTLLGAQEIIETEATLQDQIKILANERYEGGRLSVLVSGRLGESVDADKKSQGVLALTPNFGRKDVSVTPADWLLAPACFDDVVVG